MFFGIAQYAKSSFVVNTHFPGRVVTEIFIAFSPVTLERNSARARPRSFVTAYSMAVPFGDGRMVRPYAESKTTVAALVFVLKLNRTPGAIPDGREGRRMVVFVGQKRVRSGIRSEE